MTDQVDQLRIAIQANAQAASDAQGRVLAKLAELGDPDPDLSNDIATLQASTAQILAIADPTTPNPGDPDYVPSPVEPTPSTGEDTPTDTSTDTASDTPQVGGVDVESTSDSVDTDTKG